jgi:phenylalanine-4-hydroxylase
MALHYDRRRRPLQEQRTVAPLSPQALSEHLARLPAWEHRPERGGVLARNFMLADFTAAFAFMTEVAAWAEQHNHHPEWSNVYNRVAVTLTTHDVGGLSLLDIELARMMDVSFARLAANGTTQPAGAATLPVSSTTLPVSSTTLPVSSASLPVSAAPARADWTIDQRWADYTPQDHATWQTLFERQSRLLPGRACDAFVQGMQALPMSAQQIPDFRQLSNALMQRTGWQVVAVPGLVPDAVFFEHLAHRRFPAGQFIRKPHQLDYLEEPDVFHDVFGHVPMLMNPALADYMQAYGQGGLRAQKLGMLDQLARVYWYTVEFGLVQQPDGVRLYGAGLASSATETRFSLEDASPHRLRFDVERVMRTRYRIDDFQEAYFVIDSLDALLHLAQVDFGPLYDRVKAMTAVEPGTLLADDALLNRGTGIYHRKAHRSSLVAQQGL